MDLKGCLNGMEVDINWEEHNRAVRAFNRRFWISAWGTLGGIFLVAFLIFKLIGV